MKKLTLRDSLPEDASLLAKRLRKEDLKEVYAGLLGDAEQSIETGINISKICKSVVDENDRVIAVFGIVPSPVDTIIGMPWLLSSSELADNAFQFMHVGREWIKEVHETYSYLWMMCSAENKLHRRLLEKLGFDAARTLKYGEKQEDYIEYICYKGMV